MARNVFKMQVFTSNSLRLSFILLSSLFLGAQADGDDLAETHCFLSTKYRTFGTPILLSSFLSCNLQQKTKKYSEIC